MQGARRATDRRLARDLAIQGRAWRASELRTPRVRVYKETVWAWVQATKIILEKVCDPDVFVEVLAAREVEGGVEE